MKPLVSQFNTAQVLWLNNTMTSAEQNYIAHIYVVYLHGLVLTLPLDVGIGALVLNLFKMNTEIRLYLQMFY